jgi:hypothetical protein
MKPDRASPVSSLPSGSKSAAKEAGIQRHSVRNGLLCSLIFASCFWISWPVAQMGFVDDWSYIRSAQVFAQTGHLVYNGWATAMLGWQIPWGALFIRIFGFSYMAVKLSSFPLALIIVSLFYVIQTRFGIRPYNAVIGTLCLGLSPLFLPLAASFMSDIPGLFIILVCLYCCQRAVATRSDAITIAWLSLAAITGAAGGTARQIAWLGALVMVPSTAFYLRRRRGVLLAAALLWIATVAVVFYFMHWFATQPYSISVSLFKESSRVLNDPRLIPILLALPSIPCDFLCLLLVVFPVMIAWLPRLRTARFTSMLTAITFLLFFVVLQAITGWTLPWLPDVLRSELSVLQVARMDNRGPFIFTKWACLAFSILIAVALMFIVATVRTHIRSAGGFTQSILHSSIFWLLAPYALSYYALLVVLAYQENINFDRYLLGLMPVAIIVLIRLYELHVAPRLNALSLAALALCTLLAITGTHDWFAWQRARLAAIAELRVAGIPRTQIQGGFEYDGWTQVQAGHINDSRLVVPPGAYRPNSPVPQVAKPCRLDFASFTPSVHPRYTVAFPPMPCFAPSKYPPVHYRAWLPPFGRAIYVQQIPLPESSSESAVPDE